MSAALNVDIDATIGDAINLTHGNTIERTVQGSLMAHHELRLQDVGGDPEPGDEIQRIETRQAGGEVGLEARHQDVRQVPHRCTVPTARRRLPLRLTGSCGRDALGRTVAYGWMGPRPLSPGMSQLLAPLAKECHSLGVAPLSDQSMKVKQKRIHLVNVNNTIAVDSKMR